jgi:hypothetical protein
MSCTAFEKVHKIRSKCRVHITDSVHLHFWLCSLVFQIRLTLSHVASVAIRRDLAPLHHLLTFHLDTLQQHLLKLLLRRP